MFKNDADRGPLNYSCVGSVNTASPGPDAQRWENEGGACANDGAPRLHLHDNAYVRSASSAPTRANVAGYVPSLLARLRLRQE
jgi:hypothetical protein